MKPKREEALRNYGVNLKHQDLRWWKNILNENDSVPVNTMVAMIQNHSEIAMPLIAPSTNTTSVNTWDHLQGYLFQFWTK